MLGQKLKISKEEALRSTVSVNHYKSGRILFAVKSNCVDESWFIAYRTKPPDFRTWGARPYINMFLSIRSPDNQRNKQINNEHNLTTTSNLKTSIFLFWGIKKNYFR